MIYLLLFIMLFLISFLEIFYKIKKGFSYNTLLIFPFIILVFIATIRYNLGQDYHTYLHIYKNPDAQLRFEFLFRWLNQSLNFLELPFPYLFGISAFLTLSLLLWSTIKYASYPITTFTAYYSIYYLYWVFSGVRQGISNIFILLAIPYFEKKKLFPVLIITIISMGFHQSGITILILYFLNYIQFRKRSAILFLLISLLIGQSGFLNNIFFVSSYIKGYTLSGNYTYTLSILSFSVINRLLLFFTFWYFSDEIIKKTKYGQTILNVYYWGIYIYFLMGSISLDISTRIAGVAKTLDIFLLTTLIVIQDTTKNKYVAFFLVLVYCIILYLKYFITDYSNYLPFTTIFNIIE